MPSFERLLCLFTLFCVADSSKIRSWFNASDSLLDGTLPSARYGHGFASSEDGKIYLFGGYSDEGGHGETIYTHKRINLT